MPTDGCGLADSDSSLIWLFSLAELESLTVLALVWSWTGILVVMEPESKFGEINGLFSLDTLALVSLGVYETESDARGELISCEEEGLTLDPDDSSPMLSPISDIGVFISLDITVVGEASLAVGEELVL